MNKKAHEGFSFFQDKYRWSVCMLTSNGYESIAMFSSKKLAEEYANILGYVVKYVGKAHGHWETYKVE